MGAMFDGARWEHPQPPPTIGAVRDHDDKAEVVDVSIVVPTYQGRDRIAALLKALFHQTIEPSSFEVVVGVDGSDDGTRELLAGFEAPFAVRWEWEPNRGRASALNAAIRRARGSVLVFLDDDMVPAPGLLEAHRRAHQDGGPRFVMGPVPIETGPAAPPVTSYVVRKFDAHMERIAAPAHRFGVRDVFSGNASVRADVLESVGLFDETFQRYGNEDLELAIRLRKAGVEVVYQPAALARQRYDKSFSRLANDTISKGYTAVVLALKHPEVLTELQLSEGRCRSRRWQLVRGGLVRMAEASPWTIRVLEWGASLAGRAKPAMADVYLRFALEVFYWIGAREAGREHAGLLPSPLEELVWGSRAPSARRWLLETPVVPAPVELGAEELPARPPIGPRAADPTGRHRSVAQVGDRVRVEEDGAQG